MLDFFVAFGYAGANDFNCKPYVNTDMMYYLAWYNGTTTLTLTGNPNTCPDVTFEPLKNTFGIGGMSIPGNSSLDRTTYDKNPFYFALPSKSGKDIRVSFESSTDDYVEETQHWNLQATKAGDGYDITGQWIGTLPSNNNYYFPTTDCWQGGDFWPSAGEKSSGEHWEWNLSGHVSPTTASVKLDMLWVTEPDGIEWHTIIQFDGPVWADGPQLDTTGPYPESNAVAKAQGNSVSGSSSSSATGTGTASATGSSSSGATRTGGTSATGTSSTTSTQSNDASSNNMGSKILIQSVLVALIGAGSAWALAF